MELAHLLAFNLTLLVAIASPGPSLLFLTRTTLAEGRRAGIAAALGLGVMAALWTGAALLGLDAVFRLFPLAYTALKVIGATYLIWIAIQTWRHANTKIATGPLRSGRAAFLQGMTVNLANPKSVLFAGAVLVVIFPAGLTPGDKALIFANHLAIEWLVQPLLAILLSTQTIRQRYLNQKVILDRVAATILGALGVRLLLDR